MCRFTRVFIFQAILGWAYLAAPVGFSAFQDVEQSGRFLVKSRGLDTQFEKTSGPLKPSRPLGAGALFTPGPALLAILTVWVIGRLLAAAP
jgi:hypothetical protein